MSQAFFTLSLGIGAMEIFGSYLDKKKRITGEAINIICLDTLVAPPYIPHIYGNFHTLPMPMAHPAETRIKPNREANFSLFSINPSQINA